MRVLIGCEFSGRVRREFRRRGHDAWSCDLLPAEDGGEHIQGDVLEVMDDGWDMGIFHPPCTFLCRAGQRWLKTEPGRWEKMLAAVAFFNQLLAADIPGIGVENPRLHCHAAKLIRRSDQIIQPWMFGNGETKETHLWLKGLPPLEWGASLFSRYPDRVVASRVGRVHNEPPGPDRWKRRSLTPEGVAKAMADQWGGVCAERELQ